MPVSCVLYVESKQSLLRSLKQMLEPAYEVVGMADNVLSLVDTIASLSPGLIVMDLGGHATEGSLPRHIRQRFPDPAVVVLLDDADAGTVRDARTWGVQGVVDRSHAAKELLNVVGRALKKGSSAADSPGARRSDRRLPGATRKRRPRPPGPGRTTHST